MTERDNTTIGVLALQGDFAEHVAALSRLGVTAREVRLPEHLEDLDGLIIPGGESTTIGKLAVRWGLVAPLRELLAANWPSGAPAPASSFWRATWLGVTRSSVPGSDGHSCPA